MSSILAFLAALALPLTARLLRGGSARRTALMLTAVAAVCIAVNLGLTVASFAGAVLRSPLMGFAGIGGSLLIDAVSGPVLTLVASVGLVVIAFSRNYLAGEPGQARFLIALADTIAAALLFAMSGNLAFTLVSLIVVSLSLHRLLTFYPDRPAAQRAAAKKFVVSRIADSALLVAVILLYQAFGTLEIADLMRSARITPLAWSNLPIALAMVLVAVTALIKSAQLPLHGWLLEVMETPTPVSALLHAGIVNAGGFLAIRLADGLIASPVALELLMTIGAITALLASLIMLTQTTIKGQLAYSTIAQMGFMLMQCGFGAFASALLHILAHSLYKAHAFLSAGSVMTAQNAVRPAMVAPGMVIGAGLALALVMGGLAVAAPIDRTSLLFATLFLAGLLPLTTRQVTVHGYGPALASFVALTLAYAAAQIGIHWFEAGTLPAARDLASNVYARGVALAVVLAFIAVSVAQVCAWNTSRPWARALYVHLKNGLYLNTLANRMALAVWPHKPVSSVK